jgi:hypothetical protein
MIHYVLVLVIVATLPCYCAGAILLGLARMVPPGSGDMPAGRLST